MELLHQGLPKWERRGAHKVKHPGIGARVRALNFVNVTELLQPNGRRGRTGRPEQDLP
jgi:hypothetical protein